MTGSGNKGERLHYIGARASAKLSVPPPKKKWEGHCTRECLAWIACLVTLAVVCCEWIEESSQSWEICHLPFWLAHSSWAPSDRAQVSSCLLQGPLATDPMPHMPCHWYWAIQGGLSGCWIQGGRRTPWKECVSVVRIFCPTSYLLLHKFLQFFPFDSSSGTNTLLLFGCLIMFVSTFCCCHCYRF